MSTSSNKTAATPDSLTRKDFLRKTGTGILATAAVGTLGDLRGFTQAATAASQPKVGGTLRVGISGGSASDNFDPHINNTWSETVRLRTFYEGPNRLTGDWKLEHALLELCESNKSADTWTMRVRHGVEFHNGKTLTADDLLFSFQRMRKTPGPAQGNISAIDFGRTRKLDARTLSVGLSHPQSFFDYQLSAGQYIVPVGFDVKKPVSTGPWKFVSYVPGQRTVLERFPNYWGKKAYADQLIFLELPDDQARVNALIAGQVDVINQVPFAQQQAVKSNHLEILSSPTGGWNPITMRTDQAPFNDVRVRQAMRLVMNRDQAVQIAIDGQGSVASDVYGRYDPSFDSSLIRHQDIPQAKALLKAAGQENLHVELVVAPVVAGIDSACSILQQNAKAAGINISIRQVDAATYNAGYGKWLFSFDYWVASPFLALATKIDGPTSSFLNTTHFSDKTFNALYNEAARTTNVPRRNEIERDMQKILFDRGGEIIWGFQNTLDAYSSKVAGFAPVDKTGYGMGQCQLNLVHFV